MKRLSNLDFHPEDEIPLHARDIAQILRIGTSTVYKYYREGKLSGKKVGATLRAKVEFTSIDLAEFFVKIYFHEPDSALRVARLKSRELQERKRQSFLDRFKGKK